MDEKRFVDERSVVCDNCNKNIFKMYHGSRADKKKELIFVCQSCGEIHLSGIEETKKEKLKMIR